MHNIQRLLETPSLSKPQLELMRKFNAEKEATGMALGTRYGYLYALKQLSDFLLTKHPRSDNAFDKVSKDEMIEFVQSISHQKSVATKIYVKALYHWLFKLPKHQYPDVVSWLQPKEHQKKKLPEQLLSAEEVKRMADATLNLRDRAIITFLYESGCRAGELISLKIKDLQFTKYGDKAIVRGKTGMRVIPLVFSIPDVRAWLNVHPFSDDPEAAVFPDMNTKRKQLGNHASLANIVKAAALRAKLKKRVFPHLFRHSAATRLANDMPEQILKKMFGWTGASRMPATYVSLNASDVERKMLEINGIETPEEKPESVLKPRKSPRCTELNHVNGRFCINCASALDSKTAMAFEDELEKKNNQMYAVLKKLSEKPKSRPEVLQVIKELGLTA